MSQQSYFSFQWHITEACDQRCKHCYIYALGSHAQFKQMSIEDMIQVLDNIDDFCRRANRRPYLYVTGGDPILHPQFWSFVEILRERHIDFALLGNPFHLDDATCLRLAEYGCKKYQLSIDGQEETHDRIRRSGSYKETWDVVAPLRRAGIKVAVMTTVSRWNYQEVPAIIDEVVRHKVDVFAFARYCPDADSRDTCCSPEEYRQMMDLCWEKFEHYKDDKDCVTWFSLKDHLWILWKYEHGLFNPADYPDDDVVYDGCNCGNGHFTILSDGACYACRRMESKVGNALEDNLYELFTGPKMEAYREYENFEKCGKCELLRFCRGCPAIAKGYHGSMYAPDPECWKVIS
ncbi:MAG: radical SAM/SPASM domain protein, ACGX system [Bacteroidaceae bacterium]|nr:radical SAM/SPASM domain protein, ACGX system [Bacteroidaceae bacterium]